MANQYLVDSPYTPFTIKNQFKAISNGKVYIGDVDKDPLNPSQQIQVYVVDETGSNVPVSQPIQLNAGGYLVYNGQVSKFITLEPYSMVVLNNVNAEMWRVDDISKVDPDNITASNVRDTTNGGSVQDFIDAQYTTVAELLSGKFGVGQYVRLTDRAMGLFLLKNGGSPTNSAILDAGNGNTADLQPESTMTLGMFGYASAIDESQTLATALTFCGGNNVTLDGQSLSVSIQNAVSVTVENLTAINFPRISRVGGAASSFTLKIVCNGRVSLTGNDVDLDCGNLSAKGILVMTNDAGAVVEVSGINPTNCKNSASLVELAGGIVHLGLAKYVKILGSASNIDGTDGGGVARGFMSGVDIAGVNHCASIVEIHPITISNITPVQDADGIFIQQGDQLLDRQVAKIYGGTYYNCAKRAIKTQSFRTEIYHPVIQRNISFGASAGQKEIDAQYGNALVVNPQYRYTDSTMYPSEGLFSLNGSQVNSVGTVISGGNCKFDSPTLKTVNYLFESQSFNAATLNRGSVVDGFKFFGTLSQCFGKLRPLASADFSYVATTDLTICDCYVENILGDVNAAFLWSDRSGTGHALASDVKVVNNTLAAAAVDVTASYAVSTNTNIGFNCLHGNRRITSQPLNGEQYATSWTKSTARNADTSAVWRLPFNTALRLTAVYANSANEGMYSDVVITLGDTSGESTKSVISEVTTSASSGALGVNITYITGEGWNVEARKTAGAGTGNGTFLVSIQSGGKAKQIQ